jgi:hypothetical protein
VKLYQVTAHYEDGRDIKFSKYKQRKKVDQMIEQFKRNRLIKAVSLITEELGENENAGEYSVTDEMVWMKNLSAQNLGKLSAKARDTSSDAMRELALKRWGNK